MTTPDDFADLREALAKIDAIRTNEATPFSARKEHIADLSVDLGLTFTEAIAALLAAYDAALSRAEKAEADLAKKEEARAAEWRERRDIKGSLDAARAALLTLAAERDALRKALKPFAKEAEDWRGLSPLRHIGPESGLKVADLRRARALLKETAHDQG